MAEKCGLSDVPVADMLRRLEHRLLQPQVRKSATALQELLADEFVEFGSSGSCVWNEATLRTVEERLAETPCHAGRSFDRVIFPEKKAPELLRDRWLANHGQKPSAR